MMSGFKRINVALVMDETVLVPLFCHSDPHFCKGSVKCSWPQLPTYEI